MLSPLLLIKIIIMSGIGSWLSIACFNNIVDRATNRHLLTSLVGMDSLKLDECLGQGLLCRAWVNKKGTHTILWIVVGIQAIVAFLFLTSAVLLMIAIFNQHYLISASIISNIALMGFLILWLWFLCGGLWFGYWIKMSQVQTTHLLLIIIGLLITLIINHP